jgi:hypothetical protein
MFFVTRPAGAIRRIILVLTFKWIWEHIGAGHISIPMGDILHAANS